MSTTAESAVAFDEYHACHFFGSLDGIRCLSIMAVIWHHTAEGFDWLPATHNGFLGVDMFFVLSGFLIVTLLLRECEDSGQVSLRNFYMRRTLRIFPIYYALLAALAFVLLFVTPNARMAAAFFHELPFHVTYTSNWIETATFIGITWSLATEEQFYLVWPLVERFLRRCWLPILGGFIAASQLVNFRVADGALERWLGIQYQELSILQVTFTPLCLGVLLAHALHDRRGFLVAYRLVGARWAPGLLLVILFVLSNINGLAGTPRLSIHLVMMALVASCVVREDHGLQWPLTSPAMRRIGIVSYGMYLYHVFALHAVDKLIGIGGWGHGPLRFGLCAIVTYMVAETSFRYFEMPILRLKKRFGARVPANRLAVTAPPTA